MGLFRMLIFFNVPVLTKAKINEITNIKNNIQGKVTIP